MCFYILHFWFKTCVICEVSISVCLHMKKTVCLYKLINLCSCESTCMDTHIPLWKSACECVHVEAGNMFEEERAFWGQCIKVASSFPPRLWPLHDARTMWMRAEHNRPRRSSHERAPLTAQCKHTRTHRGNVRPKQQVVVAPETPPRHLMTMVNLGNYFPVNQGALHEWVSTPAHLHISGGVTISFSSFGLCPFAFIFVYLPQVECVFVYRYVATLNITLVFFPYGKSSIHLYIRLSVFLSRLFPFIHLSVCHLHKKKS